VGSGPDHLAIALASLSDLTVFALDNTELMCRIAESNVKKYRLERRVIPILGDVQEIPYDDVSMNLVVSWESFFFWENLSHGFSECKRVLRPGGIAYIGGGFSNARLREDIVVWMRKRDPSWEEKRRGWYANCSNPHCPVTTCCRRNF